ncbi:DUF1585 domain-containing protein [Melittangium boletus]|uniref:DUF1585 domain-containing protein n=1 Tax=Melittangium boletus DSM 14713 TaxID=1294270 RepID=A0A250III1_9BACT|nr:DUF1585 domain-containing protein [Melittangium boletus]ATB30982.1 hypothetical protein MEBOL_004444 [Melittangium boletus DSM 14713]
MPLARSVLAPLAAIALLGSLPAWAEDGPVCAPVTTIPLERHLRQLSLDLLGRPPTIEEYEAARAKGSVSAEDVRELMKSDAFYARMRAYHRALLWSNVSSSVNNNTNTRVTGTGLDKSPFALSNNSSGPIRGGNGATCDGYIPQAECFKKEYLQDAHVDSEDSKRCYDARGVPMPVSWDYDETLYYKCDQLNLLADGKTVDTSIPDCNAAVTAKKLDAKYLYFCDMRRAGTALAPHLCKPSPSKTTTAVLTEEKLDSAGKVIAFAHPNPPAGTSLTELKRCTLSLELKNGIEGSYAPQRGCLEREGFVKKAVPYWSAGGPEVYVCAVNAQERSENPWTKESCTTSRFTGDRSCGCGENMRRCEAPGGATHTARVAAFNEEPERIADAVVKNDEPYFNILTTRRSFVNGPLSQLYRDGQQGVGVFSLTSPAPAETLPDVPYTERDRWDAYVRGPQHSGVLTSPAFLYRFPTQRARVNHFYSAFLCKAFVPSSNKPPPAEDACNRENNLAKRCACKDCHATIEPTGAHWGRFAERGALYLEPSRFPRYDPKCEACAIAGNVSCNGECAQYVMQAYDGDGAESLGRLTSYLYRTPEEEQNIEGGPQVLVQRMLQTGAMERCTVQRIWREFLGRSMTSQEQVLYLDSFANDFARDNYSLKGLIERLVLSDAYRRID